MHSENYNEGYAQAMYDYKTKGLKHVLKFYYEYMDSDPNDYLPDEKEEIIGYCDGFCEVVKENNINFWKVEANK